jgi:hypothetical protein
MEARLSSLQTPGNKNSSKRRSILFCYSQKFWIGIDLLTCCRDLVLATQRTIYDRQNIMFEAKWDEFVVGQEWVNSDLFDC